jgi:hypothetical protein
MPKKARMNVVDTRETVLGGSLKLGVWVVGLACLCVTQDVGAQDVLPPDIVHEPCELYREGQRFIIIARFYDESPLFSPRVIYRTRRKRGVWRNVPFVRDPKTKNFMATIRAKYLRGNLEYFIQVYDEQGNGPATFGDKSTPVVVAPSREEVECVQIPELQTVLDPQSASGNTSDEEQGSYDEERLIDSGGVAEIVADPAVENLDNSSGGDGGPITSLEITPPPPAGGCQSATAPLYCSPLFWSLLGVGVAVAAGGGWLVYDCVIDGNGCFPSRTSLPSEVKIQFTGKAPPGYFSLELR